MDQVSATNRALGIPELLAEVVGRVAENSLHDVASLCVTNRQFYDVAQNVLWRSLSSLHPLLRSLGDKCLVFNCRASWGEDDVEDIFMRRAPLPCEWDRFLGNAARVRRLKHHVVDDDIPNGILDAIAIYRPRLVLLPNVEHLEWIDETETTADISIHAHLFLGPKLVSLNLTKFSNGVETTNLTNVVALLDTVRNLPSRLRSLKLQLNDVNDENITRATMALLFDNDLQVFHARGIPLGNDAVAHLAKSTSLESACITFKSSMKFDPIDEPLFPVIECLHLTMVDLAEQSTRHFIKSIASKRLSTFELGFSGDLSHARLMALLEELSQGPNGSGLSSLYLLHDTKFYDALEGHSLPENPHLAITIATLTPITTMKNLVHLEITLPYMDVVDDLVIALAMRCPLLRQLYLLPGYYFGQAPKATLNSFVYVATLLKHIQEIGFPVDVASETQWTVSQYSAINWTCNRIYVADSPLLPDQIQVISQFLYTWFRHPELKIIASEPQVPGDIAHADQRAIFAVQWEECNRLMHPWKWWTPEISAHLAG